jgi:hypothetical protein
MTKEKTSSVGKPKGKPVTKAGFSVKEGKAISKKPVMKEVAMKKPPSKGLMKKVSVMTKKEVIKEKKIGKVTHYFDKLGVAVIKLSSIISVGDSIRIRGGKETDFKQKISSIEIKGEKVPEAKKGKEIGLKVKNKVRPGYLVYII